MENGTWRAEGNVCLRKLTYSYPYILINKSIPSKAELDYIFSFVQLAVAGWKAIVLGNIRSKVQLI
jgi:hypothetical protein